MELREKYHRAKQEFLSDSKINAKNKALFARFLEYEEYKLKRQNGLASLDSGCYKTLKAYISRLRVVNRWFKNKPWELLTKEDIKQVYDALEDEKILTRFGKPIKDKQSYYRKVICSKPFEMAGKLTIVKEVIEFGFHQQKEEVRFIKEQTFREIVDATSKIEQKCFLWLCWDIGENATSILQLRKNDCHRQQNSDTKEIEYLINLRPEILKRARRSRSEITNYSETVKFLDVLLAKKQENDFLFDVGEGWAKKIFLRAVSKTGAKCLPGGQRVTLKDLRSSMACDLLSKGWSRDEVNARLGHVPSSQEIDKYINFLALDRVRPKRKVHEHKIAELSAAIEEMKERETIYRNRIAKLKETTADEFDRLTSKIASLESKQGQTLDNVIRSILQIIEVIRLKPNSADLEAAIMSLRGLGTNSRSKS